MKPQTVRVLDVVAWAPMVSYAGWIIRRQRPAFGWSLIVLGVATAVYNGRNWLRIEQGY